MGSNVVPLDSLHRHLPFQGDFKQDREPFVTQFPPILLQGSVREYP